MTRTTAPIELPDVATNSIAPCAGIAVLRITLAFEIDTQAVPPQVHAIETGNGSTSFVALHVHEPEASAFSRKNILRKLDGADFPVSREHLGQFLLGRVGRQIASVNRQH